MPRHQLGVKARCLSGAELLVFIDNLALNLLLQDYTTRNGTQAYGPKFGTDSHRYIQRQPRKKLHKANEYPAN